MKRADWVTRLIEKLARLVGLHRTEASDEDYAPIPRTCDNCRTWWSSTLHRYNQGDCLNAMSDNYKRTIASWNTCEWHEYDPGFLAERKEHE